MPRALDNLLKEEFAGRIACLPSPSAVRNLLMRSPEVAELRRSLKTGELTDKDIRKFVDRITAGFQNGQRFCDEAALCAISVALERRETPFAEEFTQDLAKLHLAEMSTAIRVARQSVQARTRLATNERSNIVMMVATSCRARDLSALPAANRSRTRTDAKKLVLCGS